MLEKRLAVPPILSMLDFGPGAVEKGRANCSLVAEEEHDNPPATSTAVYATLLDSAAGCAVQSALPEGTTYTSLDPSMRFPHPMTADTGLGRAVGTVIDGGRPTALAQAELTDDSGRLLSTHKQLHDSACPMSPPAVP
ncbi:PaaI family thioesterase [Streptomyces sp. SCL15-6]|uniref:PaaI family thioesterase n=1 Tax=Streptomyces sp. SCL15-6 TaxID=2967222 RepID=UPI0029667E6B|nr:PaaI family thioesterase [Streptomyces sp. SCL15-6]